jgi:superoxide reductase
MNELTANTVDASQEKHVPVIEQAGNIVKVKVGSVPHPMMPEHYIPWIYLKTDKGVQRKHLTPTDKPETEFVLSEGEKVVSAYEYCNLHSLWKKDI